MWKKKVAHLMATREQKEEQGGRHPYKATSPVTHLPIQALLTTHLSINSSMNESTVEYHAPWSVTVSFMSGSALSDSTNITILIRNNETGNDYLNDTLLYSP